MKAFKFTPTRYADDMLNGRVRIAPAWEMRAADGVDDGRSDPDELVAVSRSPGGEEVISSGHPAFPPGMFEFIAGGKRVDIDLVCVGEGSRIYHNYLLYCMSTSFDDHLSKLMIEKFGANALIEIANVDDFAGVLATNPELAIRPMFQGAVTYEDLPEAPLSMLGPIDPFHKASRFSWQREYRIVWDDTIGNGHGLGREALIVDMPELKPLLRRIY